MKKEAMDFAVARTRELMDAFSCSGEAKAAAQAWLDAVGTEREGAETARYVAELEADVVTIDNLIAVAESEAGAKIFGAEAAKGVAAHAREIKAAGAKYCDCPACVAALAILERKADLLG